ncbi:hypothetical protein [Amphibacillus indicireducens]|uniref:Class IIb bacteriocin, lactobin A/cerein 7B family n=1 Tax=Amphibacillus indicireducens TaxID=1076330 RepID=A0ABP7V3C2_9BACI
MTYEIELNNKLTLIDDEHLLEINGGGFWLTVGGAILGGIIVIGSAVVVAGTVVFVGATVQAAYDWVSRKF